MRRTLTIGVVAGCTILVAAAAVAQGPPEDAGLPPFLTGEWKPAVAGNGELPPGLATKDELPPGLLKKTLDNTPPGLAKVDDGAPPGRERISETGLPPGLERQGKIPPGHAGKLGIEPG